MGGSATAQAVQAEYGHLVDDGGMGLGNMGEMQMQVQMQGMNNNNNNTNNNNSPMPNAGGRTNNPCNCKKSKCLKLYCECFAAENFCQSCNCR